MKTLKQIKETWDVLVPVGSGKRFMMISPQVMESRQYAMDSGYLVLYSSLCQLNLGSEFQLLVRA